MQNLSLYNYIYSHGAKWGRVARAHTSLGLCKYEDKTCMSPSLAAAFGTHDIWDTKAALSKTAPMEKSTISKLSYPLLHQAIDGEPTSCMHA